MATNYFWKVSMLRGAAICMLDCKQSELSTCRARWLHCYLVSLTVGIIYKYQNLSPWVSVVWLSFFYQLCTYTTFKHLVHGQATWTLQYILWRNGYACASIRYQAVSLLPCDLGTRLIPTVALFSGCHPASCQLQYQYCKWWEAGWWPGMEATQAATISVSCSQAIEYMCPCLSIER